MIETLEKSVNLGYVFRSKKNSTVYDDYWVYCKQNMRPFVAITLTPSKIYARIVLDMFPCNWNLCPETSAKISDLLIKAAQGGAIISPERSQGIVDAAHAEYLARTIYGLACSDKEEGLKSPAL